MSDTPENSDRIHGGRFAPGHSGNVSGKPKGVKNRVTLLLDKMAAADAAEVLRAVLDKAKAGDLQACATVLARIWPVRRGRPVMIDIPTVTTAADVIAAMSAVLGAVSRGEITTDEAAGIATVIEASRKSIELIDLEKRLAALEALNGK